MSVVVIDPPAQIVSLALAKKQCRVDDTDSDDLIGAYIAAAQASLDGPGGWLGRALGVQTLELRLDSFEESSWCVGGRWAWDLDSWDWGWWPWSTITLPYPPLIAVQSITYEDLTGADQVLTPTGWTATDEGLTPAFGDIWPTGRVTANAVRIRYQAGYAPIPPATDGDTPTSTVPPAATAAMLLMIADLWANREAQVIDTRAAVIENPTLANLLSPLRVYA